MLSLIQKDYLTEVVNVYIGNAASDLSEMVNQKIILKIPEVEFIHVSEMDSVKSNFNSSISSEHILSSTINFGHKFTGKMSLIFPTEQAKMLANICINGDPGEKSENCAVNLIDLDFDILKEISNVILNAIVGEFGNFMGLKLEYSLPEIELLNTSNSENKFVLQNDVYILVLRTTFLLAQTQINGVIMILLSMNSVTLLINKINEVLGTSNV